MFNRVQGGDFHQFPASVGGKFTPDLPRTRTSQLTSASHQQGPSRDSPKRIHDAKLEVSALTNSLGSTCIRLLVHKADGPVRARD